MKKIILVILMLFVTVYVFGCKFLEPKLFDISLKEGLFQGVSSKNTDLTISIELTEMDTMEFVKSKYYKVKDLSTIDTKFYEAYCMNIVISEGNYNYVIKYSRLIHLNNKTTDTYKVKDIEGDKFGRKFDISDITLRLIDVNDDKIVDAFEMNYKLNGEDDTSEVSFIDEGIKNDYDYHHRFVYKCDVIFDEGLELTSEKEDTFLAGKELFFNIKKVEGHKIAMYINDELYLEIDSDNALVVQFRYVTGYRDVKIEFKLIKKINN